MWTPSLILLIIGIHCSISLEITPIPGPSPNLPDAVFWSKHDQCLKFADYLASEGSPSIYSYDFNTKTFHGAVIEDKSLILTLWPVEKCGNISGIDIFMAGSSHEYYLIRWNGRDSKATVIRTQLRVEEDIPISHVDLGAANPHGKFVFGTTHDQYCLAPANSSLYTYSRANGVQAIASGFQSTAGLAFYGNKIYHNDFCRGKIEEIYQDAHGKYKRRLVFDFATADPPTRPSGLEVDTEGYLYSVGYGNGLVLRIDPSTSKGEAIATLSSKYLVGVAFGGPDKNILFVNTASMALNDQLQLVSYTAEPPLYMITGLNARGAEISKIIC